MADIATLRASVASMSDSPALVDRAAHALFLHDGDGLDDWGERSDSFKDIYRDEVCLVLTVVDQQLAEVSRAVAV